EHLKEVLVQEQEQEQRVMDAPNRLTCPRLMPQYEDCVIMEYLVKISKKARILELKRRHLKKLILTSYTLYPSRKILLTMTKLIKEEFEKLESLKINDDSFECNTSLEIFYEEFNRMSIMGDDLFTYEVEISGLANIPCDLNEEDDSKQQMTHGSGDDMEYDLSNAEFTEWAFKEFNYLLQIDPDVLTKNIEGFKTYEDYKDDWIYEWNEDVPSVHERPWTDNGVWEEPTPVRHHYEPFNYKNGCSEWPTCSWKDDGYCNGGSLPGAYIVENTLRYQDLEWYEALKDGELKEEALKNKAIMKGIIDEDDELSNEEDEEYVAIKEHEYDDLMSTNEDVCHTYQEIFRRMDEGWMVSPYGVFQFMDTAYWSPVQTSLEKKSTKLVKDQSSGILCVL
ncbi:hypothetical protein Tco_0830942, partial [Tanacetum coccineum]